jgi:flavin reductase (DIM6/NTAB) family NADH-FMN oxidoreductase RutF
MTAEPISARQEPPMPDDPLYRFLSLEVDHPLWDRFFTAAPLVVVGTREEDGSYDLAPKHMAGPLSWQSYFGFVCTPRHATYHNARREGAFTVSFPRPQQIVEASLAASPRDESGAKPALAALPTVPARKVDGVLLADAHLLLECELDRVVDGFGDNSLIAGKVVAAYVDRDARRLDDRDDHETVARNPILVYLNPGRFATVSESHSFPFPGGFCR